MYNSVCRFEAIDVMPFYTRIYVHRELHKHICTHSICFFFVQTTLSLLHTHTHTRARPSLPAHFCCHRFASFISIRSFEHLPLLPLLLLRLPPSSSPLLLLFSLLYSHRKYYDFITFAHSFCITCAFTHLPNCLAACSACSHIWLCQCVCMHACICVPECVRVKRNVNASRETHVWSRLSQSGHFFAFIPKASGTVLKLIERLCGELNWIRFFSSSFVLYVTIRERIKTQHCVCCAEIVWKCFFFFCCFNAIHLRYSLT